MKEFCIIYNFVNGATGKCGKLFSALDVAVMWATSDAIVEDSIKDWYIFDVETGAVVAEGDHSLRDCDLDAITDPYEFARVCLWL